MMRLYRLAALAGLALIGASAPVMAHGAFGLFYERQTGCCAGCDKPWNAFSAGCPPTANSHWAGYSQMPCLPYQGPGDPNAGRGHGLHRWFGHHGCGDAGIGCGMGDGPGLHFKEKLLAKFHGLGSSHCGLRHKLIGGCEDGGCGIRGRLFSGLCGGHGCGRMRLFGFSLFHKHCTEAPCDTGCCGAAPSGPVAPVAQPQTTKPVLYQAGYPAYYPAQFVPVQYPGQAPVWGHWSPTPGYAPAYYPMPMGN